MATLTTKFDFGQRVWSIKDNKAISFVIGRVYASMDANSTTESYSPEGSWDSVSGSKCFATKEELINNIFDGCDEE